MKYKILLLALTLISCHTRQNIKKEELVGRSFDLINLIEEDTLNIEFKDSVYLTFTPHLLEYSEKEPRSWKLVDNILILDVWGSQFNALMRKTGDHVFKGLNLSTTDSIPEFSMVLRTKPWERNLIFGKWQLDIASAPELLQLINDYEYSGLDSDYYYILSESSVKNKSERLNSTILINSTNEFIKFLEPFPRSKHKHWYIKKLNDSVMILDITIRKIAPSPTEKIEGVKLIKIS